MSTVTVQNGSVTESMVGLEPYDPEIVMKRLPK